MKTAILSVLLALSALATGCASGPVTGYTFPDCAPGNRCTRIEDPREIARMQDRARSAAPAPSIINKR